jgi:nitrite reductase (NADH) small subunit
MDCYIFFNVEFFINLFTNHRLIYDDTKVLRKGLNKMSNWVKVLLLEDIPKLGARVVRTKDKEIGVLRLADDQVYAINNQCPHKGGPLSQGIVYGDKVACPLHSWKISLVDGKAEEPDVGETVCFKTRVEDGFVYLDLESLHKRV